MKHNNAQSKGFTIIELLIVIAVIAVLATVAALSLSSTQQRANDTKRIADLKSMQTAVEIFWSVNGAYPLVPSSAHTWTGASGSLHEDLGDYLSVMPVDPNHNDSTSAYAYAVNDAGGTYYLVTSLEDDAHKAFNQDIDTADVSSGDFNRVNSQEAASEDIAALDCADANVNYCLTGTTE